MQAADLEATFGAVKCQPGPLTISQGYRKLHRPNENKLSDR